MAQLDEQFDANSHESNQGKFDVVPVGEYPAMLVNSEMKTTNDLEGKYVNWEWIILEGAYENRRVFEMTTWKNKNPKAEQIGRGQFSDICRACGKLAVTDTAELHGIPCIIKLRIERDEKGYYPDKNRVSSYYAVNPATGEKVTAVQQLQQAPPAARPAAPAAAQQAAAPAARPLQPTATGKPAWMNRPSQPAQSPA